MRSRAVRARRRRKRRAAGLAHASGHHIVHAQPPSPTGRDFGEVPVDDLVGLRSGGGLGHGDPQVRRGAPGRVGHGIRWRITAVEAALAPAAGEVVAVEAHQHDRHGTGARQIDLLAEPISILAGLHRHPHARQGDRAVRALRQVDLVPAGEASETQRHLHGRLVGDEVKGVVARGERPQLGPRIVWDVSAGMPEERLFRGVASGLGTKARERRRHRDPVLERHAPLHEDVPGHPALAPDADVRAGHPGPDRGGARDVHVDGRERARGEDVRPPQRETGGLAEHPPRRDGRHLHQEGCSQHQANQATAPADHLLSHDRPERREVLLPRLFTSLRAGQLAGQLQDFGRRIANSCSFFDEI